MRYKIVYFITCLDGPKSQYRRSFRSFYVVVLALGCGIPTSATRAIGILLLLLAVVYWSLDYSSFAAFVCVAFVVFVIVFPLSLFVKTCVEESVIVTSQLEAFILRNADLELTRHPIRFQLRGLPSL